MKERRTYTRTHREGEKGSERGRHTNPQRRVKERERDEDTHRRREGERKNDIHREGEKG